MELHAGTWSTGLPVVIRASCADGGDHYGGGVGGGFAGGRAADGAVNGDWLVQGRVEAAFKSGRALADSLKEII